MARILTLARPRLGTIAQRLGPPPRVVSIELFCTPRRAGRPGHPGCVGPDCFAAYDIKMRASAFQSLTRYASDQPTLAEAVQVVVAHVLDVRVHLNWTAEHYMPDREMGLCSFAFDDGYFAAVLVDHDHVQRWHEPVPALGRATHGTARRAARREVRVRRERLLYEMLRQFRVYRHTTGEVLTSPDTEWTLMASHAAVLHWWDARMSEGHTSETARVLLALSAGPAIQHINWSPDGHPLPPQPRRG